MRDVDILCILGLKRMGSWSGSGSSLSAVTAASRWFASPILTQHTQSCCCEGQRYVTEGMKRPSSTVGTFTEEKCTLSFATKARVVDCNAMRLTTAARTQPPPTWRTPKPLRDFSPAIYPWIDGAWSLKGGALSCEVIARSSTVFGSSAQLCST